MRLQPGSTLGSYEILSSLGAGGMGEVYRARDTRLGRDVAIKLILAEVSSDGDRLARFEREARVLAALNHPNIATLYGFETDGDTSFLVMELVGGETLAERIARGPLPVDEALPLFLQIATALEAAHEQGIVHRDLKPANVKIDETRSAADGVKILDFGLAKAVAQDDDQAGKASVSMSPTLTLGATRRGEILGTAAYMAPEQARGRPIDRRADVWAFGVCLFEALSGGRAFAGDDPTATLASVLTEEPSWERLPADTPPGARRLLRRCLQKDPANRLRDIGDAGLELAEALDATDDEPQGGNSQEAAARRTPFSVTVGLAVIAAIVAGWTAWTLKPEPPRSVLRSVVSAAPSLRARTAFPWADIAITPSGNELIYRVEGGLYIRPVDQLAGRIHTEGLFEGAPFVSPDGEWIGYNASTGGTLKKVPIRGGAVVTLCPLPRPGFLMRASWGDDGFIVLDAVGESGLLRVSAAGGEPEILTTVNAAQDETGHAWPQVLPGSEAVLFTIVRDEGSEIAVLDTETGEIPTLLRGGSDARYAASGHLVFGAAGTLQAVPFDLGALRVTGDPVPVLEGVLTKSDGGADFAISDGGRLVYVAGEVREGALNRLLWVDRDGVEEPIPAPVRAYTHPRLSPDGNKLAVGIRDQENDIWIWDFSDQTLLRLTFSPQDDGYPLWAPDGGTILFGSDRESGGVFTKAASGAGAAQQRTDGAGLAIPNAISPDGSQLIYQLLAEDGTPQLYLLPLDVESQSTRLLGTETEATGNGEISPNGQWIAYASPAPFEVYVRPFPNVADGIWQVSTSGGRMPLWSRDGTELFFVNDGALWAVPVETESEFRSGAPAQVTSRGFYFGSFERTYDVSPDGRRFVVIEVGDTVDETEGHDVVMVENWFEELKRLVPTR